MKKDFRYKRICFDDVAELESILANNVMNARINIDKAHSFELKQYWQGYIEATKRAEEELERWYGEL